MRKVTLLLLLLISACVLGCKGEKIASEDNQTLLNGNWVLNYGCQPDPTPDRVAWLIINNNTVISCMQTTQSAVKGLIVKMSEGNYRFDWPQGPPSTAQYPVTQWSLLGVSSPGSSGPNCYSRVINPKNKPPAYCGG
ncbi:hypothetical protein EHQ76_15055 [Leptospira barantonii]|uniref:Lipoprotein n=1 Tax=Leptospira barantonii TaxID=2023184 RepID=A0A5F2B015_9LEPT|nr:hypothetical protein [Leptospira barantonii]TGL97452.1 hypothetical protein EHQ76_15055 [Leptospira barantonii]